MRSSGRIDRSAPGVDEVMSRERTPSLHLAGVASGAAGDRANTQGENVSVRQPDTTRLGMAAKVESIAQTSGVSS